MYTVGLYTLGCKVSQYETEAIAEAFSERGFLVLPFGEVCDAYVINTCTVTGESDRKSRQIIRRAKNKNPEAVIAVIGCYTQRAPDEVARMGGVSVILGTADKMTVVERVEDMLRSRGREPIISVGALDDVGFEPMCVNGTPRTRAYVKIEDGCECRCTYCAIADARGRVRSKPKEDVIREVESLYRRGTRECVLTGIETGSYGRDFDEPYSLADLIRELDIRHSCERIRLGSLAPELVGERFVEKLRGVKILAPHFHLSVQSGSDSVLAAMRRRYNSKTALENIERLRAAFPGACFTTDMMVGFPGETEEDFQRTVDFVRAARFLDVHVFAYSKRTGTPAAEYQGQIDNAIKKARSMTLIKVKNEVRDNLLENIVKEKRELSVILENEEGGVYAAHSDSFVEVAVRAEPGRQGEMVTVVPVSHKDGIVFCEIVE